MQDSKECFKCHVTKPLDCFYKHRAMKDGRLNKCIECAKLDSNVHRKNNLESIRAYDNERGKLPHRIAASIETTRRSRKRVTNYTNAHNMVSRAVKAGKLKKLPCAMCESVMVVGHHDDYEKPLEVIWLCQIHHKARHAFLDYISK